MTKILFVYETDAEVMYRDRRKINRITKMSRFIQNYARSRGYDFGFINQTEESLVGLNSNAAPAMYGGRELPRESKPTPENYVICRIDRRDDNRVLNVATTKRHLPKFLNRERLTEDIYPMMDLAITGIARKAPDAKAS